MIQPTSVSFDIIPFPGVCFNSKGIITNCNSSLSELIGADKNILINQRFSEFCSELSWEAFLGKLTGNNSRILSLSITLNLPKKIRCQISSVKEYDCIYVFLERTNCSINSNNHHNQFTIRNPLEQLNEAYWEWDISGNSFYLSKPLISLLGYEESDLKPTIRFLLKHFESNHLRNIYHQIQEHSEGCGSCISLNFPLKTRQGKVLSVDLVADVAQVLDGKPNKVFGKINDVTSHDVTLRRLHRHNNYLRLSGRMSNSGHWHIDLVKNTLIWSSAIYQIHGVTPKSYKPTVESALNFYNEEEKLIVKNFINEAINNKSPFRFDSYITNKQGKRLNIEVLGDVELDKYGTVVGIYGVFKDSSKTELINEKLNLLAIVNQTVKLPVLFINEQDAIVYQDISNQKESESTNLFNYINFSIQDYLRFKRLAKEEGQVTRVDISFDNFNTVFDVTVTYEAKSAIYIWIVEDITDKFRKNQQQIISNRLSLLGNTFGNVSHDINNVLGVALGATEMLELKYSLGEKDISRYIDRVKNAIDQGKSVTERLLAFTRKPAINVIKFDPMVEIEKNKYLFKQLLLSTINLTLDIDNIHCEINFPQGEFVNILLNLVLNSQDAIREKGIAGDIIISAKINTENRLEIHIKDSGVGIEDENLTKIFDPFYSSKSVNKGNGIGLSNVFSTIHKYNAEINVEGYCDLGGAHFTLTFQCKTKSRKTKSINEMKIHKSVGLAGKRVLILDDEESIAEFIALFLNSKKINSQYVTNKNNLMEILSTGEHFDVFITDMILPDISGREAVELVKNKFSDITVYSISGYIGEKDNQWHYPVLRKPFNSDELAKFLSA